MKSCRASALLDQFLIAKVQSRVTGENAHNVHALLGNYYGLCSIEDEDQSRIARIEAIAARLRQFCVAGRLGSS